jgi:hypothetical protein
LSNGTWFSPYVRSFKPLCGIHKHKRVIGRLGDVVNALKILSPKSVIDTGDDQRLAKVFSRLKRNEDSDLKDALQMSSNIMKMSYYETLMKGEGLQAAKEAADSWTTKLSKHGRRPASFIPLNRFSVATED